MTKLPPLLAVSSETGDQTIYNVAVLVTIEDAPREFEGKDLLNPKILDAVRRLITLKRAPLLDYWYERTDAGDLCNALVSL